MDITNFIETIKRVDNVTQHHEFIKNIAGSNPKALLKIFEDIPKDYSFLLQHWQLHSAYECIIETVCLTSGKYQILASFQLVALIENEKHIRRAANFLASNQNPNILIDCILENRKDLSNEFIILICHELVCKNIDLRKFEEFYDFSYKLNQESKFKTLTLYPLESELKFSQRVHNVGSSSAGFDFGLTQNKFIDLENDIINNNIRYKEVDEACIALHNWRDESNGQIAGLVGEFGKGDTALNILSELSKNYFKATKYKCDSINISRAFEIIFSASSIGGAYNYGEYGAVGRLYTWNTIHAMISDSPMIHVEKTESDAKYYDWFEFVMDNWFINVILDIGILTMNSKNLRFGIIVGTDTD